MPATSSSTVGLTTRGRCLLAGGGATAVCAVLLDERDLLRIGAFALLLPLLALLAVARTRRAVRAERAVRPERVAVGETAAVELRLVGGPLLGVLRLADAVPDGAGPDPGAPGRFVVTRIPARGGLRLSYPLRPPLRGVHRIGPLVARSTDPFGLATCTRELAGVQRLLVRPRVVALRGSPAPATGGPGTGGVAAAQQGAGTADVLVRPYRLGDELRRVHWRSTARHDELMVRLEERPWRGGVTLLLDRRDAAHRGHGAGASLEFAVGLVASAGAHLIGRGEQVTVFTEDGHQLTDQGPTGRADALLDALAGLRASARRELVALPTRRDGALLAVFGALGPAELRLLLAHGAPGHAVLLDTASWEPSGGQVSGAADAVPLTDAHAATLRRAGWHVVVAAAGDRPDAVWSELVRGALPARTR